ncbi:type III toxin-antitoxin system ToxN/AbiQ family toxin, partial [Defluviitalea phaphyphila]|uniref:type III toxin-antitoxin system ToxN/AbiQ family toxin n=1 Tax=Defluviitalea phaphyphila TaxID=1473580 RepID=UPI001FA7A3DC
LKKAAKLYIAITQNKARDSLKNRCCDFKKLEKGLIEYCKINNIIRSENNKEIGKKIKPTIAERIIAAKKISRKQIAVTYDKCKNKDNNLEI